MDALVGLLDGPRARGAFLLRSILDPPWSLRIEDEAPLTLVTLLRGEAWAIPDRGDPIHLHPGDVAIARGPDHYTVASHPDARPHVVIHSDQRCTTLEGEDLQQSMELGVRTWGNSPDGATEMLTGTYMVDGEVTQRLLGAIPPMLILRQGIWDSALVGLLADEIVKEEPGQELVLDRLLDLLLITVLRAWFSRPEAETPAWYAAHGDPIVGTALREFYSDPARPWTIAELASESGVSRAALARRFNDLVGEPPMAFLTSWRLSLAADLLREPGNTIGAIASQVGYGSPYALSAAFKRVRGVSPKEYRQARR
ncbi:MAG TPA: AraC family transcriptional regulator [Actinobacteria bacterium]|nr:AraC family transcriptional regulator [Actinomycetota bacterium]